MSGILVILLLDKSSSSSEGSEFRAYKQKTIYIICFLKELCHKDNYAIAVLGHVCAKYLRTVLYLISTHSVP